MSEYRYTKQDRLQQLAELIPALEALIHHLKVESLYLYAIPTYEEALVEAKRLKREGFNQAELRELARCVPDLFNRHKEWIPPLENTLDPESKPPEWFERLERVLQPALKCAGILPIVGYY